MLTELTLIYPHPNDSPVSESGVRLDMDKIAHLAILELANACSALPDFDTLQIVHFLLIPPLTVCGFAPIPHDSLPTTEDRKQAVRWRMRDVGDLAQDCLGKAKAGCLEQEGRKQTTMRIVELSPYLPFAGYHLASVKVEEFEA